MMLSSQMQCVDWPGTGKYNGLPFRYPVLSDEPDISENGVQ